MCIAWPWQLPLCAAVLCRGDGPRVSLDHESFTSLRVGLQGPATVQPYPINRFLVQWSQWSNFHDADGLLAVSNASWSSLVAVTVSVTSSIPLHVISSSDGTLIDVSATVRYLPVAVGEAGNIMVELASPLAPHGTVALSIVGLVTGRDYFVRASCNNAVFRLEDGISPATLSSPLSLSPLAPVVKGLSVAVRTLPSAGGQAIVVCAPDAVA
jgi:hypothetical protein